MTARSYGFGLLAALFLTVAPACAPATGRVYVRTGPPPIVAERRGPLPGPGYAWVPGFYRWNGRDHIWIAGHYERAPRNGGAWVPGRWAHDRRGWYFVEGHWR